MKKSNPSNQEAVGNQLIEEIYQIQQFSLGEGAATCQVCGNHLHEGDVAVAYVFRPAGTVQYQLGHVLCDVDQHDRLSEYTLGVRELIVTGRVGRCSDGATQSSWPVLLAPDIVGVSAAATKSLRTTEQAAENTDKATPDTSPPTENQPRHAPPTEPARTLRGDGR